MATRQCLALALLLVASGCAGGGQPMADPVPSGTAAQFLPGLSATVLAPDGPPSSTPLVVLVPGGGWTSADPTGLLPLAAALARDGTVAATLTYRTSSDGSYFPEPVQDVACGVAFAAEAAREAGHPPSQVVVFGHSAGAQLAALVALAPDQFAGDDCPYPPVEPDALVGLAGPYDVTQVPEAAASLFGPQRPDSADWDAGSPVVLAGERPGLDVLLIHGREDTLVPPAATDQFALRLQQAGHDTQVVYVDGADHGSIYSAEVAGPIVAAWLGLVPSESTGPPPR
jgi:acetyl esterase/lipase